MKLSFIITAAFATGIAMLPTTAGEEPEAQPQSVAKISLAEWQKIMGQARTYDDAAITLMMDIIVSKRCPGTAEELSAMLKIAAGMGEKRAQDLLSSCYKEGIGVRKDNDKSRSWNYIFNNL